MIYDMEKTLSVGFFFPLQGSISNIIDENVLQPLLVSTSAITLAAECVRSILKIDDIVSKIYTVFDIFFNIIT